MDEVSDARELVICGHCGRPCSDREGGWARLADGTRVCHPNVPNRPDCYRLITVYHQEVGSLRGVDDVRLELLRAQLPPEPDPTLSWRVGTHQPTNLYQQGEADKGEPVGWMRSAALAHYVVVAVNDRSRMRQELVDALIEIGRLEQLVDDITADWKEIERLISERAELLRSGLDSGQNDAGYRAFSDFCGAILRRMDYTDKLTEHE